MSNKDLVITHLEKGIIIARRFKHTPILPTQCQNKWMCDNDGYLRETKLLKEQIGEEEFNLIAKKWWDNNKDKLDEVMDIYRGKLFWCIICLGLIGYFLYQIWLLP